jgi:nucleotide-binding universal stress UspA family protein
MYGRRRVADSGPNDLRSEMNPPALLCAIDRRSSVAVPRIAGDLASSLGAQVVLTSVVEDTRLRGSPRRAVAAAYRTLDRARREIPSEVEVRERVDVGAPGAKLVEIAVEEGAELLVTGNRGRATLRSALFGSVSRELARRAPCPVLIVPPQATRPPEDGSADRFSATGIICGVGEPDRSRALVRVAGDLAARLDESLLLVHVADDRPPPAEVVDRQDQLELARAAHKSGEIEDVLNGALEAADVDARTSLEVGAPPGYGLAAVAARERARLIVVGAGGLGRLRWRPMDPSASAQLLRQARCPVLVLPDSTPVPDAEYSHRADEAA